MNVNADREATFKLQLEGFRLEDVPLKQLAEYIRLLSNLLGSPKTTHLTSVTTGSVKMPIAVSPEGRSAVLERMAMAMHADGGAARAAYEALDDCLAANGGHGWIEDCLTGRKLLSLPGVTSLASPLPAFWQDDLLQGRLVAIAYRTSEDDFSGRIQNAKGIEFFQCSEAVAKDLAPRYLQYLRLYGKARWQRRANGEWKLREFKADRAVVLKQDTLISIREEIKKAGGFGVENPDDSSNELMDIRG
ncbi:hypothetical protein [Acetobacter sp.]|uniref:hypothetical protein n=1 Tax=Acetobacter sp. TaxID=440 RepID=UPI0039EC8ADC